MLMQTGPAVAFCLLFTFIRRLHSALHAAFLPIPGGGGVRDRIWFACAMFMHTVRLWFLQSVGHASMVRGLPWLGVDGWCVWHCGGRQRVLPTSIVANFEERHKGIEW